VSVRQILPTELGYAACSAARITVGGIRDENGVERDRIVLWGGRGRVSVLRLGRDTVEHAELVGPDRG